MLGIMRRFQKAEHCQPPQLADASSPDLSPVTVIVRSLEVDSQRPGVCMIYLIDSEKGELYKIHLKKQILFQEIMNYP